MFAARKSLNHNPSSSGAIIPDEYLCILLLLLVAAVTTLTRVHLLDVPLERDEGEYAYVGRLLLQGVAPFKEAYNMKMPGIYGIYALAMALLGESIEGIHAGLLIANLATVFLLFLLGCRVFSPLVGCAAGASFATMSLSPSILGPFAHAEHFVLPPMLLGIVMLHNALVSRRGSYFFLAGVLTGLGFVILQLAAPFVAFCLFYVGYFERIQKNSTWRRMGFHINLFLAGALMPFLLVCLAMLVNGVFGAFWFWTFQYAREYVTTLDPRTGLLYLFLTTSVLLSSLWMPWAFAFIGLLSIFGKRINENAKFVCLTFFMFSLLATCPGFYFRQHYFILLLPAIALLCGVGLETLTSIAVGRCSRRLRSFVAVGLVLGVTLFPVVVDRTLLLETPTQILSRQIYSPNPFPESLEVARYIRERTSPDDRIAILGSEPQIYFYAQRRAATGYLYTYPLMENQKFARSMQEQMIQEIEAASPRYLIFVSIWTSWLTTPDSEMLILEWFNNYQRAHYRLVGFIDIIAAVVRWDQDAQGYVPRSSCWLTVFERTL